MGDKERPVAKFLLTCDNFTKSAEVRNEEVLTIITDYALAEKFTAHWQEYSEHSKLWEREIDPYE